MKKTVTMRLPFLLPHLVNLQHAHAKVVGWTVSSLFLTSWTTAMPYNSTMTWHLDLPRFLTITFPRHPHTDTTHTFHQHLLSPQCLSPPHLPLRVFRDNYIDEWMDQFPPIDTDLAPKEGLLPHHPVLHQEIFLHVRSVPPPPPPPATPKILGASPSERFFSRSFHTSFGFPDWRRCFSGFHVSAFFFPPGTAMCFCLAPFSTGNQGNICFTYEDDPPMKPPFDRPRLGLFSD